MAEMNKIPADPLAFIQKCIRKKKLFWTWHANMRMAKRFIPREAILEGVDSYEILEEYPDDKYMPSYLVYARHRGIVFHVLFAADVPEDNLRVITAYHPRPEEWSKDLKRRKQK